MARKHNFLIGYKGDNRLVFGQNIGGFKSAYPLTLFQAKRKVKPMMCAGMVIYELIELKGQ